MRYLFIISYILLIALSAQITFDLNLPNVTIPVSGQTLAILTGAVFLRPVESAVGILFYCLLGIIGLPVFSDGNAGWAAFSGGSLGYFIGFLIAAVTVSHLSIRGWAESILHLFAITILGTFIILSCGTANLALEHGFTKGVAFGFTPFLLGGLVKVILGVCIVRLLQRYRLLDRRDIT